MPYPTPLKTTMVRDTVFDLLTALLLLVLGDFPAGRLAELH